jgi:hypothetical protein
MAIVVCRYYRFDIDNGWGRAILSTDVIIQSDKHVRWRCHDNLIVNQGTISIDETVKFDNDTNEKTQTSVYFA